MHSCVTIAAMCVFTRYCGNVRFGVDSQQGSIRARNWPGIADHDAPAIVSDSHVSVLVTPGENFHSLISN